MTNTANTVTTVSGLIERDASGFRFPYDAVHVDFVLKAA
jgi:hypothetical protein